MRDIPGYEGRYAATKGGNIWAHPSCSRSKGRWLRQAINRDGYPYVCLCVNGKAQNKYVHRLVALAWLPKSIKPCVNHKNGIKKDNRYRNLEWVTASENKIHAFSTGLTTMAPSQRAASRRNIIEHNYTKRTLTMIQARKVRALFRAGKTRTELAMKFNVDYSAVKRIIANKTYLE